MYNVILNTFYNVGYGDWLLILLQIILLVNSNVVIVKNSQWLKYLVNHIYFFRYDKDYFRFIVLRKLVNFTPPEYYRIGDLGAVSATDS